MSDASTMSLSLGRNMALGIGTGAAQIVVALVSTPLIITTTGLAGFGQWSIAQGFFAVAGLASAGLGTAFQRYVAVADARTERAEVAKVMWTGSVAYAGLGALLAVAMILLAPSLASLFNAGPSLREDVIAMFELTGLTVFVALVGAVMGSVLAGLHRFASVMISTLGASVVFVGGVVLARIYDGDLSDIALSALASQAVLVLLRAWALRDVLGAGMPRLVDREERRRILAFSGRLQLNVLAAIVNRQAARVTVGIVAVSSLGQLAVGQQLADAARTFGAAASAPINSRLAHQYGASPALLAPMFLRLQLVWSLAVIGATVVGAICAYPLIAAWLGDGYGEAALFAVILLTAQGWWMLTNAGTAYLRAMGFTNLEVRYGVVTMIVNVLMTVALGLAFGAVGVVSATLVAYTAGTLWFFSRLRKQTPGYPELDRRSALSVLIKAVLAGVLGCSWGIAWVAVLPHPFALVPVTLGVAGAFLAYLAAVTRTVPTPSNARRLAGVFLGRPPRGAVSDQQA